MVRLIIIFMLSLIATIANAVDYSLPNWAKASDPSSVSTDNPFAYGGGAGGTWDDPYGGDGGLGGGGAGGGWDDPDKCVYKVNNVLKTYTTLADACNEIHKQRANQGTFCKVDANRIMYMINANSTLGQFGVRQCNVCPTGQYFDNAQQKCVVQCPERYKYDATQNKCLLDPNQCLSPYTLIAGVCVAPKEPDKDTKTCPIGYTLINNQCVKDPDKPCDPAVQECNPDGTPKCDCCEKLDTIIGNQGKQIGLHNRTNELLAQSNANQLTANLKLDKLNETATKIGDITYKGFDATIKQNGQQTELLKQIEINTRLTSSTAPTSAPSLTEVTSRQDEQTGLLAQIRDLLKDKEDSVPPEPQTPEESQQSNTNPLDSIKNYDISQNRIHAQGQCPADKSFHAMGANFNIPMTNFCNALSMLANVFLAIAYICGGIIVVKGAGGN